MNGTLAIERFVLGPWQTNCYVVADEGGRCWIVDAGFEPGPLIEFIEKRELKVERVVLTHAHVDHIAGLGQVLERLGQVPVCIHKEEWAFPGDAMLNLSAFTDEPLTAPQPTEQLVHGQTLGLGEHQFEVRHTPGHSPGGVCLYNAEQGLAIVGDTLFNQAIGRTDFPTSDHAALERSIREKLYTLPEQTRVLPGHMEQTTVGAEKGSNPFVRG